MANYFTYFSLILPLPSKEAQDYALELAQQAADGSNGGDLSADFPTELKEAIEDWQFETAADTTPGQWGIWLHTDSGGVDAVCLFIQHLLQKFNPEGKVGLEWSNDCSQPRVDAFGGGAAVITARKIKSMTTGEWVQQQTTWSERL